MQSAHLPSFRRRIAVLPTAVALLVTGCTASEVPDDAEVTISGQLTRADGAPAAGVSVVLYKEPDPGEVVGGIMATVTSLGLLCLAHAVDVCKGARKAKTDSNGIYTFHLAGRDTQGTFGTASTMGISAQLPGGTAPGPAVQARFKVQHTELAVPTLAFWEPAGLVVHPGPDTVGVRWADHPALKGQRSPKYAITATSDNDTNDVVWQAENVRPVAALAARAVADLSGYLHVTATAEVKDSGTSFTTIYDTQRVRVVGVLGPPQSRGRQCAVAGRQGEPEPLVPCSLTDGAYGQSFRYQSCQQTGSSGVPPSPVATRSAESCRSNTFLQIDLGERRPVAAVFAHGLSVSSRVVIDTSDDGTTWSRRADARQSRFLEVALPTGVHARYVRLSQESGSAITQLHELAVW